MTPGEPRNDNVNGARALLETLAASGVEFCFSNPGTSEMHLVQALDATPQIKSVLGLFEGVCTGAADGAARMSGKPASTLLHLGPGLANGIANLHNARRANTPMVNLVGNHPNFHIGLDAPLTSDIETLARNFSCWINAHSTSQSLARDGAEAVTASLRPNPGSSGRIATLIIGADAAWGPSPGPAAANAIPQRARVEEAAVERTATLIEGGSNVVLMLEHHATEPAAMRAAGRIAGKTGCRLCTGTFPARVDGGPGAVAVERLPYFPQQILESLAGTDTLVIVGGSLPASFFAYQETPGSLVPEGCKTQRLCHVEEDAIDALERLAVRLGADKTPIGYFGKRETGKPTGPLDTRGMIQSIAATMPEDLVVCTDSGAGNAAWQFCQHKASHSWLTLTGGSIGQGGPCATGAALACPDRRVLALLGDGGAAYTNQYLWTQAREGLDVTSVILANNAYEILNVEYRRLGVENAGPVAASLFDLGNPAIDWVAIARGFGVPGATADSADELCALLERSYATPGPFLIQANAAFNR